MHLVVQLPRWRVWVMRLMTQERSRFGRTHPQHLSRPWSVLPRPQVLANHHRRPVRHAPIVVVVVVKVCGLRLRSRSFVRLDVWITLLGFTTRRYGWRSVLQQLVRAMEDLGAALAEAATAAADLPRRPRMQRSGANSTSAGSARESGRKWNSAWNSAYGSVCQGDSSCTQLGNQDMLTPAVLS